MFFYFGGGGERERERESWKITAQFYISLEKKVLEALKIWKQLHHTPDWQISPGYLFINIFIWLSFYAEADCSLDSLN